MAVMVGETGSVVGIDHVPDLVEDSRQNLRRDGKGDLRGRLGGLCIGS